MSISIGKFDRRRQVCAATLDFPLVVELPHSLLKDLLNAAPNVIENTQTAGRVYVIFTVQGCRLRAVMSIEELDNLRQSIKEALVDYS